MPVWSGPVRRACLGRPAQLEVSQHITQNTIAFWQQAKRFRLPLRGERIRQPVHNVWSSRKVCFGRCASGV